ncbi:MAG: 1-deoxy-D-xylulose-5-phosphate reductoisomerase [Chloroflexi bacterium]|nr:MAG: 1-deoxy-D-xylulose-5-phosphate reductoisomerase [Chloroflexota bacterium]
MKNISILGSTGSIGCQTLDVVRAFPGEFNIVGLAAGNNLALLAEQAREFRPEFVSCLAPAQEAARSLPDFCRQVSPEEVASHPDVELVMAASVGGAGLRPIMAAIDAGKTVALANKEAVVSAGEILMRRARDAGVDILPVDSEPSALWQCQRGENGRVSRLLITASGGALRDYDINDLASVTPEQALRHPTWNMGQKITVDCATLMNKGFEVIEAHWLFDMPWEQIDVVVHPESIIHSMMEFDDGCIKAQMGLPDMRLPIQYAMFNGERQANADLPRFDPVKAGALTFKPMDVSRYPCFFLALEAGRRGSTYPAVLSAADEVAVSLFLDRRIGFLDMPVLVERVLDEHRAGEDPDLEDIFIADAWARDAALRLSGV